MSKQSKKLDNIPFSSIRKIFDEVARLRAQGKDVINLGIGEPDFDTPASIKEAMFQATREGATHYTPNKGVIPLRQAIIQKLEDSLGVRYDLEEIICTAGVAEGVYIALSAFLDPGDEVLVPDPSWLNYSHVPVLNGAVPVPYVLTAGNNFQIDVAEVERLITSKTKMLVILDPSNPTGGVQTKAILEKLAEIAVKHDLLVVSDEIYDMIVYDGMKHYSIASCPGMRERTIILNGFSKTYAMTGWRLGFVAAPAELIPPLAKLHAYILANAPSMVQYGGIQALTGPQDSVAAMVSEFKERRDYLAKAINEVPGLSCPVPGGAFYVFVDVSGTGMTGEEFAQFLLKEGIGVVPGTAFGRSATHQVRISYASSLDVLKTAMVKIKTAVERHMNEGGR